jgi:hypothetical protein
MRAYVSVSTNVLMPLLLGVSLSAQLPQINPPARTAVRAMVPGQPPTSFTALPAGPRAVRLSWNAPVGATGYVVSRAESAGGPYTALTTAPITGTVYVDPTVSAQRTYVYRVAARYPDKLDGFTAPQAVATPCDAYCAKISCAPPPATILDIKHGSVGSGQTWRPTIKVTARDAATGSFLPGSVTVNGTAGPLGETVAYPPCRTRGPNAEIVVCRGRVTITGRGTKLIIAS